jgi:hypothetical protein
MTIIILLPPVQKKMMMMTITLLLPVSLEHPTDLKFRNYTKIFLCPGLALGPFRARALGDLFSHHHPFLQGH